MTNAHGQIVELQANASDLPHGQAQVALLEEAVQLADSVNDVDLAYRVRDDLMTAATFSSRPDILLIAFSWCLAQYDRNPQRFDREELLWKYKWVIEYSCQFPEISRQRLEDLLADMERRYREAGSTLNAAWLLRRKLLQHFGEWQRAKAAHAEFRSRRRDSLSDCPACVAFANCDYYCGHRQWGRAVQVAQPVLLGRLTCTHEPHRTLSSVLRPLFHLGRLEEAKTYRRQGYRLISAGSHFVGQHADHLRFAVLIGELAQARHLLERHLPGALQTVANDERFQFLLAVRLWADRLVSLGTRKLKLRVPEGLPAPDADGKSDATHSVSGSRHRRTRSPGVSTRNGTSAFQQQIDALPELLRLAVE